MPTTCRMSGIIPTQAYFWRGKPVLIHWLVLPKMGFFLLHAEAAGAIMTMICA